MRRRTRDSGWPRCPSARSRRAPTPTRWWRALGGPLPDGPTDPARVVDLLAEAAEPGLMAMGSGRFYGWVIGGTLPAALAADWLVSAWDQNTGLRFATPATVAVEEVAAAWLLDLLGLPATADVGFVTGGTMANFTGLVSGRHALLTDAGWDVNRLGLLGGPRITVLAGAERHDTVDLTLRYLGLGEPTAVAADDQGRVRLDALADALDAATGPVLLCLQAGNVHSGAFDPLGAAIELAHARGAWVHVDGAFGLFAGASPKLRHLVAGYEAADSWATDAHKTLNVPYDCGIAVVSRPDAMRGALGVHARLPHPGRRVEPGRPVRQGAGALAAGPRGPRVGGAAVAGPYRGRGPRRRDGRAQPRRSPPAIESLAGAEVLNEVPFTQVCASFGSDERTQAVTQALLADGAAWMSGSRWHDRAVLRVSVSNWSTDASDVERSVDAVRRAVAAVGE